jgi:hypothetical protein
MRLICIKPIRGIGAIRGQKAVYSVLSAPIREIGAIRG